MKIRWFEIALGIVALALVFLLLVSCTKEKLVEVTRIVEIEKPIPQTVVVDRLIEVTRVVEKVKVATVVVTATATPIVPMVTVLRPTENVLIAPGHSFQVIFKIEGRQEGRYPDPRVQDPVYVGISLFQDGMNISNTSAGGGVHVNLPDSAGPRFIGEVSLPLYGTTAAGTFTVSTTSYVKEGSYTLILHPMDAYKEWIPGSLAFQIRK